MTQTPCENKTESLHRAAWFALIALGHPVVFFLYLTFAAGETFGSSSITMFGYPSFTPVETNVYRMNPFIYTFFAFGLYALWLHVQILVLARKCGSEAFLKMKLGKAPRIISALGIPNILLWINGMEGNIFGFFFAPPMMLLIIASFIIFIRHSLKVKRL